MWGFWSDQTLPSPLHASECEHANRIRALCRLEAGGNRPLLLPMNLQGQDQHSTSTARLLTLPVTSYREPQGLRRYAAGIVSKDITVSLGSRRSPTPNSISGTYTPQASARTSGRCWASRPIYFQKQITVVICPLSYE